MAEITEIAVTETGNPTFQLRLDCKVDGVPKTYFGTGVPGCPEGAEWFCGDSGSVAAVEGLRDALLQHSETRLNDERLAVIQSLMG